jgi:hypothetical protein
VKLIFALSLGGATALVSILIHQTLPPFGVIAALIFTYLVIWLVGRNFGGRRYKVAAAFGWLAIMLRAATFGVGQELLVQADVVGSTLLLLGTLLLFAAVAARI